MVVIAPIKGQEMKNSVGLSVALGGAGAKPVPTGDLTSIVITSVCPTFADKPKIFFFIDPEIANDALPKDPVHIIFLYERERERVNGKL